MRGVTDWLKTNWQFVTLFLTIVGAVAGVKFTIKTDPAAVEPQVIVIIPGDDPLAVRAGPVGVGEWTVAAKLALKAAILILETRAPRTPSDLDDRLLAFLKTIDGFLPAFLAAEASARGP